MAVNELLVNLKSDTFAPASVIKAVKANAKVLDSLTEELATKTTLNGKNDGLTSKNALDTFTALANECMPQAQPFLCKHLGAVLASIGSKNASKDARAAGELAAKTICEKISPNAVREIMPVLIQAADQLVSKWQTRVAGLLAIASFADHAPEQLGFALPQVLPEISKSIVDTKKEVSAAAEKAMLSACDVIGNRDIEHMTGPIVRSVTHPEDVPEIMHKLAGVTFVQSVESPALAMVTPLLVRGLQSGVTSTMRQSAVIIENMSKLVDDPIDAAPFMPLLMPALEKAADTLSDPEARSVAERAFSSLSKLNELVEREKARQKKVEHSKVLAAIKERVPAKDAEVFFAHVAHLACSLAEIRKFDVESWEEIKKVLSLLDAGKAAASIDDLRKLTETMVKPLPLKDDEDDDDAEELCNCTFTLAYGTKILLHNTVMRLKRGAKYGLLGGNDSGKTTLMRSIANGSVEGFPDASEVRTVFVEADILGELSHLSCVDYIMADPRLQGLKKEEVLEVMATVGFREDGKAKPNHAVSTLSGGWRMKLAMARAMLQRADILLLDEPTNHLDVINVKWVKNYINSLKNVTCIMVSHDSGFLNDCCTNIMRIDRLKLQQYKGNLESFIEQNPDAKAYFSLKETKIKFRFPQPGAIEGIKSRSKALMKMSHCDFTYPGNDKPTLYDITIQVSMASRVGCVGENGAGKSTMIKVLTGEVIPQTGDVWKHPNARIAYVAQHAFHHIENHLDKTANEYIRWRYADGEDKESLVKVSMVLTDQEKELQMKQHEFSWKNAEGVICKGKKIIDYLPGTRRQNGKEFEYEVVFRNEARDASGIFIDMKTLQKCGWIKTMMGIDARIAQTAGMLIRPLTSSNVEQHLADVGLEPEFATHYRMGALSGGQKVKVVLAAALWNQPHILILDEPTNYLDRPSLSALASAVQEFQGGVIIISHNNEFVSTVCKEEWAMDAGRLTQHGDSGAWMDKQDLEGEATQAVIETMVDAFGNAVAVKGQRKKLNKKELKVMIKKVSEKIKAGLDLDSEEEEVALEHNLG